MMKVHGPENPADLMTRSRSANSAQVRIVGRGLLISRTCFLPQVPVAYLSRPGGEGVFVPGCDHDVPLCVKAFELMQKVALPCATNIKCYRFFITVMKSVTVTPRQGLCQDVFF
eukprot:4093898-Amphidinium_carterae.1